MLSQDIGTDTIDCLSLSPDWVHSQNIMRDVVRRYAPIWGLGERFFQRGERNAALLCDGRTMLGENLDTCLAQSRRWW